MTPRLVDLAKPHPSQPPSTRDEREVALYVGDMAQQLSQMAKGIGLTLTSALLTLAAGEARRHLTDRHRSGR